MANRNKKKVDLDFIEFEEDWGEDWDDVEEPFFEEEEAVSDARKVASYSGVNPEASQQLASLHLAVGQLLVAVYALWKVVKTDRASAKEDRVQKEVLSALRRVERTLKQGQQRHNPELLWGAVAVFAFVLGVAAGAFFF